MCLTRPVTSGEELSFPGSVGCPGIGVLNAEHLQAPGCSDSHSSHGLNATKNPARNVGVGARFCHSELGLP